MLPQIHIRRLVVRYRGRAAESSERLDELAARVLPAQLERALAPFDDGRRIVVLRRLSARLELDAATRGGTLANRWADSIAASVRAALAGTSPSIDDERAVFSGPIEALAAYVEDALAGRLDRWVWAPSGGALPAVLRALASLPGSDGMSHAFASAPSLPAPGTTAPAVEWALRAAGAALPALVDELRGRGQAAAALAALPAEVAAELLLLLDPTATETTSTSAAPPAALLELLVRATETWPAAAPLDPRNRLLVVALGLARRPSLRGVARLDAQVTQLLAPPAPGAPAQGTASAASARSATPPRIEPAALAAALAVPLAVEPEATPAEPQVAARAAQACRFGGVLFLLPLVRDLGLADAVLASRALAESPGLPAILYALACSLVPSGFADAALLAFAGVEAPCAAVDPADPEATAVVAACVAEAAARLPRAAQADDAAELRALADEVPPSLRPGPAIAELCHALALHLVAALRARLGSDAAATALLARVLERRGELGRTRSHLDFFTALDDVDFDVRRAALDVNPGWVSFLGRVVSIHYL